MTQKDRVFVVDVVITELMQERMTSSVINRPTGVVAKLSAIAKITSIKGFMKGTILF